MSWTQPTLLWLKTTGWHGVKPAEGRLEGGSAASGRVDLVRQNVFNGFGMSQPTGFNPRRLGGDYPDIPLIFIIQGKLCQSLMGG
jgi:hypothetical protein